MTYINGKYRGETETIDEFETRREARAAISEYRLAFGADWEVWLSSRSTREWRERAER